MRMMKFAVFTTGYKGISFLKKVTSMPEFVVTYDNKERANSEHYKEIIHWCEKNNIKIYEKKHLDNIQHEIDLVDKLFVVGWQYILKNNLDKLVVFHDSYLPERRGFSPTVSALLDKSPYLGATSFLPSSDLSKGPDYGQILYRRKKEIQYPIKLKDAFDIVSQLYADMCIDILKNNPNTVTIDYDHSTFSMWRDQQDTRIDWDCDAKQILQKIYSLGYPYDGARTTYNNKVIFLQDASVEEDVTIMNRADHIGKIFQLREGCPYIICGTGIICITKAKDEQSKDVIFNKLRKRFS